MNYITKWINLLLILLLIVDDDPLALSLQLLNILTSLSVRSEL